MLSSVSLTQAGLELPILLLRSAGIIGMCNHVCQKLILLAFLLKFIYNFTVILLYWHRHKATLRAFQSILPQPFSRARDAAQ
jgi:hypothetical protein